MQDWVQFAGRGTGTIHLRNPRQKGMTLCHRKVEWFARTIRVPAPVCTVCASKSTELEVPVTPAPSFEKVAVYCPSCGAAWMCDLLSDESIRKALSRVRCPGQGCIEIGSARLGRRGTLVG